MSKEYLKQVPDVKPGDDFSGRAYQANDALKFNALPYEERKRRIKAGRKEWAAILAADAATALAVTGLAMADHGHKVHHQPRPAPIERIGGHEGLAPTNQPGTGTLQGKSGEYQFTHKGGIGTAVAAEAHDGGPIIEHEVKP